MHHLQVQGFLGIESAEITLDGLTVLIGPQASGKSVIARLIYFFNEYLADFDITAIFNQEHKKVYDRRKREEFYEIFPPYSWQAGEFSINYLNDDHEITVLSREDSAAIEIITSPSVAKYFRDLKNIYRRCIVAERDESWIFRTKSAFGRYLKSLDLIPYESALFVPASRLFYATLRDEIFSILVLNEKIDRIMAKFGEFYENAKAQIWRNLRWREYVHSSRYFKRILEGRFIRESGQDWLQMAHGRIELSRASSGQQEALPLLVSILRFPGRNRTLIIEEPEAHLFPEAQVEVLNFMVRQLGRKGGNIMFTTHSPYLLPSLNNRIVAHERGAGNGISIDRVHAYSIEDGVARTLIDEEAGLIHAEYIDSVSERIADEFEKLISGR